MPHMGVWGAGGWAGGMSSGTKSGVSTVKRVGGDPVEAEEAEEIRDDFHRLLLKQYTALARAWCELDIGRRGRISFNELCRACRKLGYDRSVRLLWESLDQDLDGFVSLPDIDAEFAGLLEALAVTMWVAYGTVEAAWKKAFNPRGAHWCNARCFMIGCDRIGFQGDVMAAYEALNSDLGTTGLTREEFGFLELFFAPQAAKPTTVFHDHVVREADPRTRRPSLALPIVKLVDPEADKKAFRKCLIRTYGNYVKAWRQGLDRDGNGILDENELKKACADIGYAGERKKLWEQLDNDGSGEVSLREIDQNTFEVLRNVLMNATKRYGEWDRAWKMCMDVRGDDRVDILNFIKGARAWGYGGNAEHLFDLLDMDRAGYLTYDVVKWVAGSKEDKLWEDLGDGAAAAQFKQITKSQARKQDFRERELRLDAMRFATCDNRRHDQKQVPQHVLRRSLSVASAVHPKGTTFPASVDAIKYAGSVEWGEMMASGSFSPKSKSVSFGMGSSSRTMQHSATSPKLSSSSFRPSLQTSNTTPALDAIASMTGGSLRQAAPPPGRQAYDTDAAFSPKARGTPLQRKRCPLSPGKGGWSSSRMGLARIANKQWREGLTLLA